MPEQKTIQQPSIEQSMPVMEQKQQKTVLDQVLDAPTTMQTAKIASWAGCQGTLTGGQVVQLSASCLIQPLKGDTVLVWPGHDKVWVINILARKEQNAPTIIKSDQAIIIDAPKISIAAETIQINAEDMVTYASNSHAVEQTRTEQIKVKVTQVGTDIRRADRVFDQVKGSILQRAGTWIVNTAQTVRHKARTVLFD